MCVMVSVHDVCMCVLYVHVCVMYVHVCVMGECACVCAYVCGCVSAISLTEAGISADLNWANFCLYF